MSRAARDQPQRQLCARTREKFDKAEWANVLRLVFGGHSRALRPADHFGFAESQKRMSDACGLSGSSSSTFK